MLIICDNDHKLYSLGSLEIHVEQTMEKEFNLYYNWLKTNLFKFINILISGSINRSVLRAFAKKEFHAFLFDNFFFKDKNNEFSFKNECVMLKIQYSNNTQMKRMLFEIDINSILNHSI